MYATDDSRITLPLGVADRRDLYVTHPQVYLFVKHEVIYHSRPREYGCLGRRRNELVVVEWHHREIGVHTRAEQERRSAAGASDHRLHIVARHYGYCRTTPLGTGLSRADTRECQRR